MSQCIKIISKALSVVVLSAITQSAYAIPFTFEGRSLGMAGASVATADLATAAWANPAMLTNQPYEDDFSLLIGLGAFLRDNDDLQSDIDDFQDADERLQNATTLPEEVAARNDMLNIVKGRDGKDMAVDASVVIAMGMAFESFSMAVSIRSDAIGAGTVTDLAQVPADVADPAFNILNVEGVLATEIGL